MAGPVEQAIRSSIAPSTRLKTPTRDAPFVVDTIDPDGVVLLLGEKQARTRLSWECLEGVVPFPARPWADEARHGLPERRGGGVARRVPEGPPEAAAWVAAVLEKAGVVEVARTRPATVRLVDTFP